MGGLYDHPYFYKRLLKCNYKLLSKCSDIMYSTPDFFIGQFSLVRWHIFSSGLCFPKEFSISLSLESCRSEIA